MEDKSQRSRPESSNSANTRMTPTSSNSSSAHLPVRNAGTNGTRAPTSGGASLLHEREGAQSRKREAESQTECRFEQWREGCAELAGKREWWERRGAQIERGWDYSWEGGDGSQADRRVSTLHKQNFDLKLELFHRRQRQETLEHKLQEAEKQIEEQAELQEVNDELLAELEKRDQAVEEAVNIIVTLEEKVDRLMKEREGVRSFEADYESTCFRPSHDDELPSSPPRFDDQLRPQKSVPRMPSFLSEPSQGVEALRSLYLPYSESTLPNLTEDSLDGSPDHIGSPRLSVLSESSFISVYGEKKFQLDVPEDEAELPRRHRRSTSVENWIDERPVPDVTPVKPTRNPALQRKEYLSINDVLESPLQRLEKLKHTLEKANGSLVSTQAPSSKGKRKASMPRLLSTDTHSFDRQHTLPPTPDTISTDTLRHFKNSNDAMLQHRKASGTFLNSTSTFPTTRQYQSDMSLRPRSAGETITSRREGHGWDTETQEEFTETGSISSTNSTYNGTSSYQRPTRARTPPDLFSFGGGGDAWGRDVRYNDSSRLPPHPAHRFENIRRSSMANHPESDDTVVAYQSQFTGDERPEVQHPLNSPSQPYPPDRRSSLAATTKLRKTAPPNNPSTATAASSPLPSPEKDTANRRSRFSTRFFIRPEKPPMMRSQSYVADEEARATPPPIRRNRTQAQIPRPSSASGPGVSGYDAAADGIDGDVGKSSGVGGKKWFGMGRTNSLRRS
ncbi:hypothetical protein LSUB1_G006784 [Lachnellula subtilissima]|uniref:Centrosomin N-terminal motif 1 domain-containing protein n=1 Tax=Lachnellula subtilissima TaxID=602034 RepID=A0A8H8U5Z7_9HELO|nr:hypothetical protein LSUB1_G006784 [Lachnellula subtilissima]